MSLTPIHDFLTSYASKGFERCHMPGHKSINNLQLTINNYLSHDITEISQEAIEIIKESERNAAELFGAKRTLFSCSGSTLAIYAMLSPFANKRVAVTSRFHRSFIDAAILLDFEIQPEITDATDAVFVTNIDYYGNMADIKSTADFINRKVTAEGGKPSLLVDNAHGAYLVFTEHHPIKLGAAMCADSAHKTLPALTGAAYLHISKSCYVRQANDAMCLFGTSSPSYLILESLDLCNRHISEERKCAELAFEAVADLKKSLCESGYSLHNSDLLRVTVDVNAYGYKGEAFAGELKNHGVICEMFDPQYVILMFSTVTTSLNTSRVLEAMRSIGKKPSITTEAIENMKTSFVMSPRKAYFSNKRTVPVMEAVGEVCAGVHVTTPPCVPVVVPGEVVTREIAELLMKFGTNNILIVNC
jgi:arginine/lysine/ornithine decarboxylase